MKRALLALAPACLLVLSACSGGTQEVASSSAAPSASPSAPASSSAPASPSTPASPSPSASEPETILAVLCDSAAPESVAAIEAVLKPDYTLSQVVDVRTDDDGSHAILGFVEGPGLAVLAQWTGTGLDLKDLAAADEFAAQVTDVPMATPDEDTQDLLGQTVTCYTNIHAPEDGDDKKQDDESQE
ncbi:MAG: hypothetical protein FJW85_08235 [Actinobacteria bacterium]|nr:hypothetical protein [Actinomycetota bacterium]